MNLELVRDTSSETSMLGQLLLDDERIAYTLERPWLSNEPFVSCIPEGTYQLEWVPSGLKNSPCYRVLDVKDRTDIEVHTANQVSELFGCIALGVRWGEMVMESRDTLNRVHDLIGDRPILTIRSILVAS